MASMGVTDRNGYERIELSVPNTGVQVTSRKTLPILTVLLVAVLAVLTYALVDGFRGWAHGAVLAGIILTVIGTMLAVDPARKG